MPIIQGTRRIDPLDLGEEIFIGVALPLNEVTMFTGTTEQKEQIKTNILNVLLSKPGENLSEPEFGVGLANLLFENNIDLEILKDKVQAQVSRWVGSVEINSVSAKLSEDGHTISLKINYTYLLDGSVDEMLVNYS
jgi:phage baseplate assembly protein W